MTGPRTVVAPRARLAYLALALATVGVGLAVHRGVVPLAPTPRDVAGDALWAAMVTWGVGALAPRLALARRALVALAWCWLVEASQRVHTPTLDALRATTPGHLVLGQSFDARDLLAYALGVAAAAALESAWRRRRAAGASGQKR